jgi:hypothetical protein
MGVSFNFYVKNLFWGLSLFSVEMCPYHYCIIFCLLPKVFTCNMFNVLIFVISLVVVSFVLSQNLICVALSLSVFLLSLFHFLST